MAGYYELSKRNGRCELVLDLYLRFHRMLGVWVYAEFDPEGLKCI